ncbi:GntR family transcriptional regulator [Kibdelosporangium persicum]|uniref:GntR family transcriptional regulator n=1 Tax=Kibdelosporangium persicum TaxID=2698649 RepID=A0ABX2EVG2_9PSEU|nr:GntR family transcriptional regulator [Kibdelosporangium persicum]NRN62879.1 GntR family transcriptional regulator [Kibdelosporangium persicum]
MKKKDMIAGVLRHEIMAGRYPSGSMLPSETQLMERFTVSRTPVRDAITMLKAEGLISVHHGKGAVVRVRPEWVVRSHPRKIVDEAKPGSGSPDYFDLDLEGYQWDIVDEPTHERVRATAGLALMIGVREGTDVFVYDQLLDDGQGRRMFHRLYLPFDTVNDVRRLGGPAYRTPTELYSILAAAGYEVIWREGIRAMMPPREDATRLRIPDATPMLVAQRIAAAPDGRPFAMEETRISAENAKFVYELVCASGDQQ